LGREKDQRGWHLINAYLTASQLKFWQITSPLARGRRLEKFKRLLESWSGSHFRTETWARTGL